MRFSFFLLTGSAALDPCEELCVMEGPEICTHGSKVIIEDENEICSFFYYSDNPEGGRYFYSTLHRSRYPIMIEDVPRLLARGSSLRSAPSNRVRAPRGVREFIRLYSEHALARPEGVEEVTERLLSVSSFLPFFGTSAEMRWANAGGPELLALVVGSLGEKWNEAALLPFILAGGVNVQRGHEAELAGAVGLDRFCSRNRVAIQWALKTVNRRYRHRIVHRPDGFVRDSLQRQVSLMSKIPLFCPDVTLDHGTRSVLLSFYAQETARSVQQYLEVDLTSAEYAFEQSYQLLNFPNPAVLTRGRLEIRWHDVRRPLSAPVSLQRWFTVLGRHMMDRGFIDFTNDEQALAYNGRRFKAVGRFLGLSLVTQVPVLMQVPQELLAWMLGRHVLVEDLSLSDPRNGPLQRAILQERDETIRAEIRNGLHEISAPLLNPHAPLRNHPSSWANIVQGFHEVVSLDTLSTFGLTPAMLGILLFGDDKPRLEYMIDRAYLNNYSSDAPQLQWLRRYVGGKSDAEQRVLLELLTGSPQTPSGGFDYTFQPLEIFATELASDEVHWDSNNVRLWLPRYRAENLLIAGFERTLTHRDL